MQGLELSYFFTTITALVLMVIQTRQSLKWRSLWKEESTARAKLSIQLMKAEHQIDHLTRDAEIRVFAEKTREKHTIIYPLQTVETDPK